MPEAEARTREAFLEIKSAIVPVGISRRNIHSMNQALRYSTSLNFNPPHIVKNGIIIAAKKCIQKKNLTEYINLMFLMISSEYR